MASRSPRARLHATLNLHATLLSQSEWDALDKQMDNNLVRKAVGDNKFTSLTADKLLARLRAKPKVAKKAAAAAAAVAAAAAAAVAAAAVAAAAAAAVRASQRGHQRGSTSKRSRALSRPAPRLTRCGAADRLQAVRGRLAEAAHVFDEGCGNQRYVMALLASNARLVLASTERAPTTPSATVSSGSARSPSWWRR